MVGMLSEEVNRNAGIRTAYRNIVGLFWNRRIGAIMNNYALENDKFKIRQYEKMPPFSSFLPGLAGVRGIPVWTYYTNRGQAVHSFGIHNKDNAIMEFNPANTVYENAGIKGFRTFIRIDGAFFEPFVPFDTEAERSMSVEKNRVDIAEESHGLKIEVGYFVLPNESMGALVRQVKITNTGDAEKHLEVLDGMSKMIPYGITNTTYKAVSNLMRSWTDIRNLEQGVPYVTMRGAANDSAEAKETEGGYFYLPMDAEGNVLPVVYDQNVVWGYETSLVYPVCFAEGGLDQVHAAEQCFYNKIPCMMTEIKTAVAPGASIVFNEMIGFAGSVQQLNAMVPVFTKNGYIQQKAQEAQDLIASFMKDVTTHTAEPKFDQYVEQCYLDNFLRGGYPYVLNKDTKKSVIHLFSRKHGDPERDYNFFSIAGEYYSQGNGNFRDACQNRRNDVFFNKDIDDFDIYNFFSLIQADGYNPLEVRPCTFVITEGKEEEAKQLLQNAVDGDASALIRVIEKPFTPGQISNTISRNQMALTVEEDTLISQLLLCTEQKIEAGAVEGYWSDHWDYLMDLVDDYLLIYPDRKDALLYGNAAYRYYDNAACVQPRSASYVLSPKGVRQYGSRIEDKQKMAQPGFDPKGTNWLKTKDGQIVEVTLMAKMLSLAVNKFALLDSCGMGIEMEGGNPGWNDAMNGLPGLFGSGMPESFELKRLLLFIINELSSEQCAAASVALPAEIAAYIRDIYGVLKTEGLSDFAYWDQVCDIKEAYRASVKFSVSGEMIDMPRAELAEIFAAFYQKLEQGFEKAMQLGDGIVPTYITFEAVRYEEIKDAQGNLVRNPSGYPTVKVQEFRPVLVPYYLEGPARMLAASTDVEQAAAQAAAVKASDLYDAPLKMYKTSVSIENVSAENGRIRVFTPGWLERESIFLHMEYKYILGLLRAGLYDQYYETIQGALIPFLDPAVYGRSTLENSSFIASSVNPDPAVRGRGFQARLSGSTVEVLSMWIEMFFGKKGFSYTDGVLSLELQPKLASWLFDAQGMASFKMLSSCQVTYINQTGKNTYGADAAVIASMELTMQDGSKEVVDGAVISGKLAEDVRSGKVSAIKAYMN